MYNKTPFLVIGAVVLMLAAVTDTNAYHETWDGWFNSATLYYDGKTYSYVEGEILIEDVSGLTRDTFYVNAVPRIAFICAAGYNDSIFVYIDTTITGGKETGQSGTKEGSGSWSGSGYSNRLTTDKLFDFGGTWEAEFEYTDFYPLEGTCEGSWRATWSFTPEVARSYGGISGEMQ